MRDNDNRRRGSPDYILAITREIWEDRGLSARMRDYYHRDVIVRTPAGVSTREAAATRATLATLQEFPDRVLLGEDVIWLGDPEAGMLSSHRILSTATHAGDGAFGPATGTAITWRTIADCYASEGQISDEWRICDTGAVVRQMGHAPQDWARAQIAAEGGPEAAVWPLTPVSDVEGPYTGCGNDNSWGARLGDLLKRMMAAEFSVVPSVYDRACQLEYPGGVTAHGPGGADRFWLPLRSAFPSADFTLHHVIGREDTLMPPRAAVRWSLWGRHDGWGPFGRPTGAEVYVMGITHAEFGPWGLRREWTLIDETAIWKQILLAVE
jgi:hypothetical protein